MSEQEVKKEQEETAAKKARAEEALREWESARTDFERAKADLSRVAALEWEALTTARDQMDKVADRVKVAAREIKDQGKKFFVGHFRVERSFSQGYNSDEFCATLSDVGLLNLAIERDVVAVSYKVDKSAAQNFMATLPPGQSFEGTSGEEVVAALRTTWKETELTPKVFVPEV